MIGDIVNLSARLMQAAQNEILCDAATYHEAQASAALELMLGVDLDGSGKVGDVPRFSTLEPISVKGKTRPIAIYRPCSDERMTVTAEALQTPRQGRRKGYLPSVETTRSQLPALHQQGPARGR